MAKEKAGAFKYVGDSPEQLASGRPVAPGDTLDLTDEELKETINQALINDGKIIGANDAAEKQLTALKTSSEAETQTSDTKEV